MTFETNDGIEGVSYTISAVPEKWVDWTQRLLFWPPRSLEATSINKWSDMDRENWTPYLIKEVHLRELTKEKAGLFLNTYQTDAEDTEDESN